MSNNTGTSQNAPQPVAAIDIGTNSAHLVIAMMENPGSMRVLDTDKVTLRLGDAIDQTSMLREEAIERTTTTLSHMHKLAQSYNATIRAVATHAARAARNFHDLRLRVLQTCGIDIEVIDGVEEARLVFLGMRYGLSLGTQTYLGLDIGGGSSELITASEERIAYASSFKLGAVVLSKIHFADGVTDQNVEQARAQIRSSLAPIANHNLTFDAAIASAGTAKAVALMVASYLRKDPVEKPNGYKIKSTEVAALLPELIRCGDADTIKSTFGLDKQRAEIITAGVLILSEFSQHLGIDEWTVTTYGLREGLVADTYFRATGAPTRLSGAQWSSVEKLAQRLELDTRYSSHVAFPALRIFGQMAALRLQTTEDELVKTQRILQAAAFLHEAGKFLSTTGFHKHSRYIVENTSIPGFTEYERRLMGLVVRSHRKAPPKKSSADCQNLSADQLETLSFLSGVLRLATTLDRTRKSLVHDVKVIESDERITLELCHLRDRVPDVELYKLEQERKNIAASLGKTLEIKVKAT